jgi:ubiquinone/menaquinone biosynthesis C-methylase UbiE
MQEYGKRKTKKEKKLKRRYRVYKKGGKFRTGELKK